MSSRLDSLVLEMNEMELALRERREKLRAAREVFDELFTAYRQDEHALREKRRTCFKAFAEERLGPEPEPVEYFR
jgi:hypothetical protein